MTAEGYMETEHTPPTAAQLALERLRTRARIGSQSFADDREVDDACEILAGLLRPDTPSAALRAEVAKLVSDFDTIQLSRRLDSVGWARARAEALDRTVDAILALVGGLAVGSEPSIDALIEQLVEQRWAIEMKVSPTGALVTVGVHPKRSDLHAKDTLRDALSAALAASAPKGE